MFASSHWFQLGGQDSATLHFCLRKPFRYAPCFSWHSIFFASLFWEVPLNFHVTNVRKLTLVPVGDCPLHMNLPCTQQLKTFQKHTETYLQGFCLSHGIKDSCGYYQRLTGTFKWFLCMVSLSQLALSYFVFLYFIFICSTPIMLSFYGFLYAFSLRKVTPVHPSFSSIHSV